VISGAEVRRRRTEHRRRRVPAALHEPVRDARVTALDRVPKPLLWLGGLTASVAVHLVLLGGASRGRPSADLLPSRPAEIKVAVIERSAPPAPPQVAAAAEVPAPTPRRRPPRATAAPTAPVHPPAPPQQTAPTPAQETPQVTEAPPLLMPGVSLSATTAAGGLAVRGGLGAGGPGSSGTPGGGGGGAREPGGGTQVVPGYALTEEPVFLDNVSAADMRRYYPEEARKAKIEGPVRVKLLVDENGAVARATLINDPSGAFARAAIKVAHLYRFKPARVNDRRVATEIEFTIHFELD
jgi:protein TonB